MDILKVNLEDFKNGQNDRERQIIRLRTEIKTADQTLRMKDSENQEVTLFPVYQLDWRFLANIFVWNILSLEYIMLGIFCLLKNKYIHI